MATMRACQQHRLCSSASTRLHNGISLASRTRTQWLAPGPMRPSHTVHSASGSAALPDDSVPNSSSAPAEDKTAAAPEKKGLFAGIKKFFVGDKMDKQRLAELGMGAFASYGSISNLTYGICMTIAWISFVRVNHVSPLAPGQWKGFLVYYAGLFTFQNIVRPLRFSAAIALAPLFDRAITRIGEKLKISKKGAFGVMILIIGCTTTFCLGSALWLLGGFPPTPPHLQA